MDSGWLKYLKELGKDLKKVVYLYPKLQVLKFTWKALTGVIRLCGKWRNSIVCYIGETSIELDGKSTLAEIQAALDSRKVPNQEPKMVPPPTRTRED